MKKIYFLTFILLTLSLLGAGCLPSYKTSAPPAFPPANNNQPTPSPSIGGIEVQIQNFSFLPAELTVKVGTTVKWTNQDAIPHTVSGDGLESGTLGTRDNFSFTFNQSGAYNYHCAIHPSMIGKVIVE